MKDSNQSVTAYAYWMIRTQYHDRDVEGYSIKLDLLADLDIGLLTSTLPALGGLWLV